jgi:ABC-type Mn2+/Zn2+ transport system permease subunit
MKLHLKTLLVSIAVMLGMATSVFGLYWLITINPWLGIGVIWVVAAILIYMSIYNILKSEE